MTQKSFNGGYWQTSPMQRDQIVLLLTTLEDRIPDDHPDDHPVRLLDEILDEIDWTDWEKHADVRERNAERIHCSSGRDDRQRGTPMPDHDGRHGGERAVRF